MATKVVRSLHIHVEINLTALKQPSIIDCIAIGFLIGSSFSYLADMQ